MHDDATTACPAALWQRWFDEVWEGESEAAIDTMALAETRYHGVDGFIDTEGFKAWRREFLARFRLEAGKVQDPIVQGEWISVRTEFTLRERETDATYAVHGQQRAIVRDGRFVEVWDVWDWTPVLEAAGAIPGSSLAGFLTPPA